MSDLFQSLPHLWHMNRPFLLAMLVDFVFLSILYATARWSIRIANIDESYRRKFRLATNVAFGSIFFTLIVAIAFSLNA